MTMFITRLFITMSAIVLLFMVQPAYAAQDPACIATADANFNSCVAGAEATYDSCRDAGTDPATCGSTRTATRGACLQSHTTEKAACPEVDDRSCVQNAQTAYDTCITSTDNTYTACNSANPGSPTCSQQRAANRSTCSTNRDRTLTECSDSSDCAGAAQREYTDCIGGSQGRYDACISSGVPQPQCATARTTRDTECRDTRTATIATCPAATSVATPPISTASIADQYASIQSQGIIFGNVCTSASSACPCRDNGDCTLNDVLQVVVNIAIVILGISGSLVLLMFVIGGFMWLFSEGNTNMVETGKQTMVGAAIGLLIIFGAYAAITFLVSILINKGAPPAPGATLESTLDAGGIPASGIINSIQ